MAGNGTEGEAQPVARKGEGDWAWAGWCIGIFGLRLMTLVQILYGSHRVCIFFDDIMVLRSPISCRELKPINCRPDIHSNNLLK